MGLGLLEAEWAVRLQVSLGLPGLGWFLGCMRFEGVQESVLHRSRYILSFFVWLSQPELQATEKHEIELLENPTVIDFSEATANAGSCVSAYIMKGRVLRDRANIWFSSL